MTLTREAIKRSVFDRLEMCESASAKSVEATFEIIQKTLEKGEDILISGFGKFCGKDKGETQGQKRWDRQGADAGRDAGCDLQVFDGAKKKTEWWRGVIWKITRAG
jgi:Bacterial DNA-binding protein